MPALANILADGAGLVPITDSDGLLFMDDGEEPTATTYVLELVKRINIPYNSSSPAGLIEANTRDPWNKSGKYALGWVYYSIILLALTIGIRLYYVWTDKTRTALHHDNVLAASKVEPSSKDYELSALSTDHSTNKSFPKTDHHANEALQEQSSASSFWPMLRLMALMRFIFYRPIPVIRLNKRFRPIVFPSLSIITLVGTALVFVLLYCFVPQPLYWQSIRFGSPPLAIRAGMIAVAMMPWIVALGMKANIISLLTGIGHERLNVLHRWLAYLCLLLSLIHMIPFYVTPVWTQGAWPVFKPYLSRNNFYIYGTGENATTEYATRFSTNHSKASPLWCRCSFCAFTPYHRYAGKCMSCLWRHTYPLQSSSSQCCSGTARTSLRHGTISGQR